MKTILVPTDFSIQADYALNMAVGIAHMIEHVQIKVINMVEWPLKNLIKTLGSESETVAEIQDLVNAKREFNLQKLSMFLSEMPYSQASIDYDSRVGSIHKGILDAAEEHKADLIIMGTKGTSELEEMMMVGSNAEKIVRKAKCPVLTLQEEVDVRAIQNIIFVSRLNEDPWELIAQIKRIQQVNKATIHIIKVNTPRTFQTQKQIQEQFARFEERHEFSNYTTNIYNHETEEDGVLAFAADLPNSLIAMGTHGRTGISHLVRRSITKKVVNHSPLPVLTHKIGQ